MITAEGPASMAPRRQAPKPKGNGADMRDFFNPAASKTTAQGQVAASAEQARRPRAVGRVAPAAQACAGRRRRAAGC